MMASGMMLHPTMESCAGARTASIKTMMKMKTAYPGNLDSGMVGLFL